MKRASFIIYILVCSVSLWALEITNTVTWNNPDQFANYFDSATPVQIFKDVVDYIPNVHKNRNTRRVEEAMTFTDRKADHVHTVSSGRIIDNYMHGNSPTYTLRAFIWYDNDNEGYIYLFIDNGTWDFKIIHYILNPAPSGKNQNSNNSGSVKTPSNGQAAAQGSPAILRVERARGEVINPTLVDKLFPDENFEFAGPQTMNVVIDGSIQVTLNKSETKEITLQGGKHTIYVELPQSKIRSQSFEFTANGNRFVFRATPQSDKNRYSIKLEAVSW